MSEMQYWTRTMPTFLVFLVWCLWIIVASIFCFTFVFLALTSFVWIPALILWLAIDGGLVGQIFLGICGLGVLFTIAYQLTQSSRERDK